MTPELHVDLAWNGEVTSNLVASRGELLAGRFALPSDVVHERFVLARVAGDHWEVRIPMRATAQIAGDDGTSAGYRTDARTPVPASPPDLEGARVVALGPGRRLELDLGGGFQLVFTSAPAPRSCCVLSPSCGMIIESCWLDPPPEPRALHPGARTRLVEVRTHGALSPERVRRFVMRRINHMRVCYANGSPDASPARVRLRAIVSPIGTVQTAVFDGPPSSRCMLDVVRGWSFPQEPEGGFSLVELDFHFSDRRPPPQHSR